MNGTLTDRNQAKIIRVTGCREGCPKTRHYYPDADGETLGCVYRYGSLPKHGFPDWCPLADEPKKS